MTKKTSFITLTISQKILISFASLLLINAAITAITIFSLSDFHQRFSDFQKVSHDTIAMLKIDNDVSELQRHILAYSNTEKTTTISQLEELHTQLSLDIKQNIQQNTFPSAQESDLLMQMQQGIASIKEKIEALNTSRSDRNNLIGVRLPNAYKFINTLIDSIFNSSDNTEKGALLNRLWEIKSKIATTETISGRYFNRHEFQYRKDLTTDIIAAEGLVDRLKKYTKNVGTLSTIDQLDEQLVNIKNLLNQALQADRNYLFLVNVVIAGESSELTNLAQLLKMQQLKKQQELYATTEAHINRNQIINVIISIGGALLALLIAMITGRKISLPLKAITNTLSQLAKGDTKIIIPEAHRTDEIGQLAQAANIFRETNQRTNELLESTEKLAQELTNREQALELAVLKAEDASKAKSQFLANMSHELRTPMNAIIGMLTLIQRTELSSRQIDYVVKSDGAARSLLLLLNDILDISKPVAGKIELDPIAFSLEEMLRDLNVILSANLTHKPLELILNLDATTPKYLTGDLLRLQQILINLAGNAIKFTARGSVTITITPVFIDSTSSTLEFSVTDTGIGIAIENQQRIFNGFSQAEASTTRRYGGTGLGLTISKHLVNLMGGELQLESALNQGSRFYFTIDLALPSDEEIAALAKQKTIAGHDTGKQRLLAMKILLVEDNLNNQQIALELLEAEGAQVQIANNGQEALTLLKANLDQLAKPNVDVVLMDLQMPVMDGISATIAIRNELHLQELPIVAMTANAMESDRIDCLKAGMNEHLGKPFDLLQLVQVLRDQAGWNEQTDWNDEPAEWPIEAPADETETALTNLAEENNINLSAAVARFGGNQKLYLRMLPKFIVNLEQLVHNLNEALELEDTHSASRLAHSLKGLAGTMGLDLLAEAAKVAEKQLQTELELETAQQLVIELIENIKLHIPKLQRLLEAMELEAAT